MWGKELLYLSIATVGIICILGIILLYLVLRKVIENRQKNKINQYKEQLSEPLFSFILSPEMSRSLIPDNKLKIQAIEQLLDKYVEVLEGDFEKKNLYSLAELYLTDYYKSALKSRNWSKRMNALYHIEDFKIRFLQSDVKQLINYKRTTREERVLGLRVLAYFDYENLFEEIHLKYHYFSEYEYRSILLKASDRILDELVISFHKSQIMLQKATLDLLAHKNELKYVPFIESVCHSYSGEIRLRALKTLAAIGYVKDISHYLPLCKSSIWEERMMAAKLLGTIQDEEGLNCLISLLHDPFWWVRSQAAQSIKKYQNGNKILKNVYQTSKDPFAVDMAWEWINKGD
jgi:hypothetical protein